MKKIPARFTWLVMPALLVFLMTFVVSGVSTLRAIGLSPDFVSKWMQAWLISYVVAYPTMLAVGPTVRRIVAAIVAPPPKG